MKKLAIKCRRSLIGVSNAVKKKIIKWMRWNCWKLAVRASFRVQRRYDVKYPTVTVADGHFEKKMMDELKYPSVTMSF